MRLWHEALIPYLPRQQLLGLHREVCALRGLGWGKKHSTVDYVFQHPYGWLQMYHYLVTEEMIKRGYNPDLKWYDCAYRGENLPELDGDELDDVIEAFDEADETTQAGRTVYPEHNDAYLQECLENLAGKGIKIDMEVKP